jgi:hypothetical protein
VIGVHEISLALGWADPSIVRTGGRSTDMIMTRFRMAAATLVAATLVAVAMLAMGGVAFTPAHPWGRGGRSRLTPSRVSAKFV